MWVSCDSCKAWKKARVTTDHAAARRISCSECGHEFENDTVLVADPITPEPQNDSSFASSQPQNDPSVDLLSRLLEYSQNLPSDSVSFDTSQPQNDFSVDLLSHVLGSSQNPASDSVSVATSQPHNVSFDDGLSLNLENSPTRRGSDTPSIATTEENTASSDDFLPSDIGSSQKRSLDPLSISPTKKTKATVIATMSQWLGLPATVENEANEILKMLGVCSKEREQVLSAACIFIACRSTNDQTRSLAEISSVVYGPTIPDIEKAIEFIAEVMGIDKVQLFRIKAVDFMKRFCSNLGMNSEAVKAAEEAARNYDVIDTSQKGPESVAAAVLYVIDQLSNENKLFKDIIDVTGVAKSMLKAAYVDMYPNLSTIIPNWFANADDLKNLASP